MHSLANTVQYAVRRLIQAPGFAALVVITLALGIGANTAIFSAVNALLLRPLPYPDAQRLVQLNHFYPTLNNLEASISPFGFREYGERTTSFEALSAQAGWSANLTGRGEAQRLTGSHVSADWFRVFGVRPARGRAFTAAEMEPGNDAVVLLSDGLWQRLFGGDAAALGQSLLLNGRAYEIVGIMPADFRDFFMVQAQFWTPLALTAAQLGDPQGLTNEWLAVTGRLRPGVTSLAVTAELDRIAAEYHELAGGQLPDGWTIRATPLEQRARGDIRPLLLLLLGAVGFVLLIACVNVANLLLARAAGRTREIAVRTALGATRGMIVRQMLLESVVIALVGGFLGLLLAFWVVSLMAGVLPPSLVPPGGVPLDATVLLFTLSLSVGAGLLFGAAPAIQVLRRNIVNPLRSGGRGSTDSSGQAVRRVLVVGELALALTLLTGAGLLIRSFDRLQNVDPGFQSDRLLTFDIALSAAAYPTQQQRTHFFSDALERITAMPGVESAGATSLLPFSGSLSTRSFVIADMPATGGPQPWGEFRLVSEGYAEALGMRVVRGRFFTSQDRDGALPVAVVDELMVQRFWPDADPIGQRIAFAAAPGEEQWREVVGVVAHTKHDGFAGEDRIQIYYPLRQATSASYMTFAVRTTGDPARLAGGVRDVVRSIDPDQPLHNVTTMHELMRDSLAQRRLAMMVLAGFSALALLLAATGIYGVMAQLVSDRTRELGVRMSLGATTGDVLRLVFRQAAVLTGAGVVLGVVGALALTRFIEGQLYGIDRMDPWTYAAVITLLAGSALLATGVPALRAAGLEPTRALRAD